MKLRLLTMSAVTLLGLGMLTPSASAVEYKVESGDTLYTISNKYGVSVEDIMTENNLESDELNIDEILNIPTADDSESQNTQETEESIEAGIVEYVDLQNGATLPNHLIGKWKTDDGKHKIEIKEDNYLSEKDEEYKLIGYKNISEYVYVFDWDEDLFKENFLKTPESKEDFNPQPIYIDFFPGEDGDKGLDKLFYNGLEMIRDNEESDIVDEEGPVEEVATEEDESETSEKSSSSEDISSETIEEAVESIESVDEPNSDNESSNLRPDQTEPTVESKVVDIKQDESTQSQVIVVETTTTTESPTTEDTTEDTTAEEKAVTVEKNKGILPQTGEESSIWLYIVGGLLLVGATVLMFFGKKDKNKELDENNDKNNDENNDEQ